MITIHKAGQVQKIEKIFLPGEMLPDSAIFIRGKKTISGGTKNKTRLLYTLHYETILSITIFNDS